MKAIVHLHSVADLYKLFNLGNSHHPLVAVLDFSNVSEQVEEYSKISTDFYSIMFKNYCKNNIKYGRKAIDFQDGNLICIAPNQTIEIDNEIEHKENMMGWGLFFHPDLIRATSLNDKLKKYSFFNYEVSEALHLSDKEKNILFDCVQKIQMELQENIDVHSQFIIVSTIELLLNYCSRFYGRQMITRSQANKSILAQIETILNTYFSETNIKSQGLPSVAFLAEKVNLSPSYLSDLLKKETGKNAQEHIHFYLIEQAKTYLINTEKNINEIAFSLGFEYPQYFNKLFKQKTGKTPLEYRTMN
ncbi:AraC family transcriptional regulator [Flavobacterium sp. SOK18b]|uniref:helix-turn-helix domain-containing protein n=1 Tax=Flavobacterium sp. SOK18b TaxID=797900 RepID=UPI0015F7FED9|nr:helix-turn-helix transcriptional regulator [Flavobacterium sp. SOK18b]MBB1195087.1 AraC family transcriptional regulator [Flavobacterium sp. SOK18b]